MLSLFFRHLICGQMSHITPLCPVNAARRVSVSRAYTQDANFYPTDSAMQLAAGSPTYQGGAGNGIGYSLNAAWEYQFAPKLIAGGLLSIERSDFFAPNRAVLYLRYSFDRPRAQPVFLPPELVEPSSQF